MNPTNSKKVSHIFTLLFVLVVIPAATKAQSYTPEETSCYNMVQGKVAWNTSGNTSWNEANVRNLCKGTTNAGATVSCFRSQISSGVSWDKAIAACPPAALPSAPQRNSTAILPDHNQLKPSEVSDATKITFKNNGLNAAQIRFFRSDQPFEQTPVLESRTIGGVGETTTLTLNSDIPPNLLQVEVRMVVFSGNFNSFTSYVPIYLATVRNTKGDLCFEATGSGYENQVKPCLQTLVVEAKRISFRNEAAFGAKLTLDYQARDANGGYSTKTATTDDTVLGFKRALYIPRDAALDQKMTMKVNVQSWTSPLLQKELLASSVNNSTCYKVWGSIVTPKTSPCTISAGARTIKLNNNSGFSTMMEVVYNDGGETSVRTNIIELLQSDAIEIPYSAPNVPIQVKFYTAPSLKVFSTNTISSTFTGQLCYRTEGTLMSPTVSNCDNSVGDASDANVRQIRFQNDSAFDAQMTVMYFVNEKVDGNSVPMPKTAVSGFINGLGGKFRMINIPNETSPNMPINVLLTGSATVKDGIFATTLPANFAASPQPCFKVWGTLFNPGGGTCDQ